MQLCKDEIVVQNFDNFYMDNSNKTAFEVIKKMSTDEEMLYSPILFVGKSGVGKSHLINSLENSMKDKAIVVKVSSDEFIQEVVKDNNEISNKYEKANIFIVEDIQFLSAKKKIQKILYNIIEKLKLHNAKIILTVSIAKQHLDKLDFIEEMNFKDFDVIEINNTITDETKNKIIHDFVIKNGLEIDNIKIQLLIKECNTFVELKNKLNSIKLLQDIKN